LAFLTWELCLVKTSIFTSCKKVKTAFAFLEAAEQGVLGWEHVVEEVQAATSTQRARRI
jgi:hypothetical protein